MTSNRLWQEIAVPLSSQRRVRHGFNTGNLLESGGPIRLPDPPERASVLPAQPQNMYRSA